MGRNRCCDFKKKNSKGIRMTREDLSDEMMFEQRTAWTSLCQKPEDYDPTEEGAAGTRPWGRRGQHSDALDDEDGGNSQKAWAGSG